jgi:glutaredoxin-like YruB-family protein
MGGWVVAVVVGLVLTGAARADIYKWTDEKGIVHVENAPPAAASKAKVKVIPASRTDAAGPVYPTSAPGSVPGAPLPGLAPPRADRVEIYTTVWCGVCGKAKDYFRTRGIAYTEYDVEKDPTAAGRFKNTYHARGVPLVIINGRPILGYSEAAFGAALSN